MSEPEDLSRPSKAALLRRADQGCIGIILAAAFVYMGTMWAFQQHRRGGLVDIERAKGGQVTFHLDINTATWPELELLPGIGETLARRIVAYREAHGPFGSHHELQEVYGMGSKTLAGIRPYLKPIVTEED